MFLTRFFRFLRRLASHLAHLRFAAFLRELGAALRRISLSLRSVLNAGTLRRQLAGRAQGKRVIVFPPTLDWDLPLFQRPQQMARAYSEKEDTLVLYLTANHAHDRVGALLRVSDSLWLVNASLARFLPALLRGARETVVSLSWTVNRRYVPLLRPDKLIYEYIDELEIFDGYDEQMRRDHLALLRQADLTVCTAARLYAQVRGAAHAALYSPNAGDYDFFSRTSRTAAAPEAAAVSEAYRFTLGYYGALAEWFDYGLVAAAADAHADWLFLLVGMDYDGSLRRSGVLERHNVRWIPPQPYARLPSFLRVFDLALIPFLLNEVTLSTSPVKLFEYMAARKPILCSRMPECMRYRSVETYADPADFLRKAADLLERRGDPALLDLLDAEARANTWGARADEILRALESPLPAAEPTRRFPLGDKKAIPGI